MPASTFPAPTGPCAVWKPLRGRLWLTAWNRYFTDEVTALAYASTRLGDAPYTQPIPLRKVS